jgi:hypothetical protein
MTHVSDTLQNVKHHLVNAMYMRKDFSQNGKAEDVLVIEVHFSQVEGGYEFFDKQLTDLLLDLEHLKDQVEECVGKFQRVDIRTH